MWRIFAPILGFVTLIGAVAISVIGVRYATARIRRMEGPPPGLPDEAYEELRAELHDMQERVDFLERALLAQQSESRRLSPGAAQE